MLAKVFVYAALFATSAFGAAVPATSAVNGLTSVDVTDAVAAAEQRGIDVKGPIPNDAQAIDGGWSFSADSEASSWALAQVALSASSDLEKREYANIGIGMWAQDNCGGQGYWFDNVQYGYNSYATINLYSIGISYRGLRSNEHLDFSRISGSDWCGSYLYSAKAFTPTGCFGTQAVNCFRLWT